MSNGWAKVSDGQCKRVQEACEVGESDIRARDDLSDRYVTHDQNCLCQPWNRRTGKMAPASITREIGFRTDLRRSIFLQIMGGELKKRRERSPSIARV